MTAALPIIAAILLAGCTLPRGLRPAADRDVDAVTVTPPVSTTTTAAPPAVTSGGDKDAPALSNGLAFVQGEWGWMPSRTNMPGAWRSGPFEMVGMRAMARGSLVFETRGIRHGRPRNDNGGWEYFLFLARGSGFDRLALFNVGGGGGARADLRMMATPHSSGNVVSNHGLEGAHEWRVRWGDGRVLFYLDGELVREGAFRGTVEQMTVGGYDAPGRHFKGEWRNARLEWE